MTLRAYLTGITGTGTHHDAYRSLYSTELSGYQPAGFTTLTWGGVVPPTKCMVLVDLDAISHTLFLLHLEVRCMDPALNMGLLDIGGFNSGAEAFGFAVNNWTAINMPYTTVCRRIAGEIFFSQAMSAQGGNISSIAYNQTISSYSTPNKTAFYNAITASGLSIGSISDSTSLRNALTALAAQNDSTPVIGGAPGQQI